MIKNPPDKDRIVEFPLPGMKGLSTWLDPQYIDNQETPDISNMTFDAGMVSPRRGSELYAEKPDGESADALQSMVFKTSVGVEYLVNVFGNNFYLHDIDFDWIKLNGFTPDETDKVYGYTSWNGGILNDRAYFCNGYDDFIRWNIFKTNLTSDASSGATSIVLDSVINLTINVSFVSSVDTGTDVITLSANIAGLKTGDPVFYRTDGTVITGLTNETVYYAIVVSDTTIKLALTQEDALAGTDIDLSGAGSGTQTISNAVELAIFDGSNYEYVTAYDISGNTVTITALSQNVSSGSAVVQTIYNRPSMIKGKIVNKYRRRLVSMNAYENETRLAYSVTNDPEDFSVGSDPTDGNFFPIADGEGEITSGGDFGKFFLVAKGSNLMTLTVDVSDDQTVKIEKIEPLISGNSMGPLNNATAIKVSNAIYYPTEFNGIYRLNPTQTGNSATTDTGVLSTKIQNFVQTLNFDNGRVTHSKQKIYWLCGTGEANDLVLVYDINKNAFTKFNNWPAADLFTLGGELYYLSRIDGKTFRALTGRNDNNNPYTAYFFTKRLDFGKPHPKTSDAIYVEGFITPTMKLYADVLFNENGSLATERYLIDGADATIVSQIDVNALSEFPMAVLPMDLSEDTELGIFKCYLSIPNGKAFYSIEVKFYGVIQGCSFGINTIGFTPELENQIPPGLRLSPLET